MLFITKGDMYRLTEIVKKTEQKKLWKSVNKKRAGMQPAPFIFYFPFKLRLKRFYPNLDNFH